MSPPDKTVEKALIEGQLELFVADFVEPSPPVKGDRHTGQWPIFTLSTRGKDMQPRTFKAKGGEVTVLPSGIGLANQDDKKMLVYIVSQLVAGLKDGRILSEWVEIRTGDLYRITEGEPDKDKSYGQWRNTLKKRLQRLTGTQIDGPLGTVDGEEMEGGFSLVEAYVMPKRMKGRHGKLFVKISPWVIRLVRSWGVLTYHPDYYKLDTPLVARLYEVARFFVRTKESQKMRLSVLRDKVGSTAAELWKFRQQIKQLLTDEGVCDLLDYVMRYNEETDQVTFTRTSTFLENREAAELEN